MEPDEDLFITNRLEDTEFEFIRDLFDKDTPEEVIQEANRQFLDYLRAVERIAARLAREQEEGRTGDGAADQGGESDDAHP